MWKWRPESHSQICQLHVPGSRDYLHEGFSLCLESTTSMKTERNWHLSTSFVLFLNLHYSRFYYYHQTDSLWNSLINKIHHFRIIVHVRRVSSSNLRKYGHWNCARSLVPMTGAPKRQLQEPWSRGSMYVSEAVKLPKRRFVYTVLAVR